MMPLDIGDMLVDRDNSAILLSYLAKAAYRVKSREIAKRKLEISIDRLKKLSTKELHRHINELEDDIEDALQKATLIKHRQTEEEGVHRELNTRLKRLHDKLDEYMRAQQKTGREVAKLDEEIDKKFAMKKEKTKALKEDIAKLNKLYEQAKKSKKYTKKQLSAIQKRIKKVQEGIGKKQT